MLIYITLCTISMLSSCSSLTPVVPSADSFQRDESKPIDVNVKRDVWAVLNSLSLRNYEDDSANLNESLEQNLPKLTIWEFPTERRVFIGDVEIFISSKEDAENSNEAIDTQNLLVLHPHKSHSLHKNIADEKQYPAFRAPKFKRYNNEKINSDTNFLEKFDQNNNDGINDISKYFTRLSRDKRTVETRELNLENDYDIHNEMYPGLSKERKERGRRVWAFYDYLKSLLNYQNQARTDDSSSSSEESEEEKIYDTSKVNLNSTEQALIDILANNVSKVINLDHTVETKKSDQRTHQQTLLPADPEIIKIIQEDYKNGRIKKRNINSDSDINLLINPSDVTADDKNDINLLIDGSTEDDNVEFLYNGFVKFLQTGKDFYNILVTYYYLE